MIQLREKLTIREVAPFPAPHNLTTPTHPKLYKGGVDICHGDEMSQEPAIDPHILENPEAAKQAVLQLLQVKAEIEDLIDTLEMLSDPEFQKNMDDAIAEVERGEIVTFKSLKDLEKFLED